MKKEEPVGQDEPCPIPDPSPVDAVIRAAYEPTHVQLTREEHLTVQLLQERTLRHESNAQVFQRELVAAKNAAASTARELTEYCAELSAKYKTRVTPAGISAEGTVPRQRSTT